MPHKSTKQLGGYPGMAFSSVPAPLVEPAAMPLAEPTVGGGRAPRRRGTKPRRALKGGDDLPSSAFADVLDSPEKMVAQPASPMPPATDAAMAGGRGRGRGRPRGRKMRGGEGEEGAAELVPPPPAADVADAADAADAMAGGRGRRRGRPRGRKMRGGEGEDNDDDALVMGGKGAATATATRLRYLFKMMSARNPR